MAQVETRKRGRPRKVRRKVKRSAGRPVASGLDRFRTFLRTGGQGPNSHVILLGIETFDSPDLLRAVARGLPYSAFERLVANTSFASEDALVLVNIPSRTLTRRKRDGRFHEDESDRLVRASRLFGRALSLFEGNRDAAKHWLSAPQRALGGAVPFVCARTEVGALEVERLMGRLEHGVFA